MCILSSLLWWLIRQQMKSKQRINTTAGSGSSFLPWQYPLQYLNRLYSTPLPYCVSPNEELGVKSQCGWQKVLYCPPAWSKVVSWIASPLVILWTTLGKLSRSERQYTNLKKDRIRLDWKDRGTWTALVKLLQEEETSITEKCVTCRLLREWSDTSHCGF